MGFNKRHMERERAAARGIEDEQRKRALGRDTKQAEKLVAPLEQPSGTPGEALFYPTIETSLLVGMPWLEFMCPGCRQCGGSTCARPIVIR